MNRLGLALLILFFISACSRVPEKPVQTDSALWQAHRSHVNAIRDWHLTGRLAIRNERDSGTLTLHWKQTGNDYEMRFIAPLGQGTYTLTGSSAGVTMRGTDNTVLTAATAEELMQQVLGWSVHLDGLQYWVRGLPAPGIIHEPVSLDQKGRLRHLEQAGFNIHLSRYTELDGVALPEKLTIKNDTIQLKLIITNWTI